MNDRLEAVHQAVHDDPYWEHLRKPGINLVPGYGNAKSPRVLLVGEAPGATENAKGRPFCGPSGRVLNILMQEAGLYLDWRHENHTAPSSQSCESEHCYHANAYVTNVVKYRPPGNRTPSLPDILHAKDSLRAEWRALGGPRVIVCVGGVAHTAMSPVSPELSVSAAAGNAFPARTPDGTRVDGYWVISQLHPAYGLRKGEGTQKMMSRQWAEMGKFLRQEGIL
jgi:DNA polymerase